MACFNICMWSKYMNYIKLKIWVAASCYGPNLLRPISFIFSPPITWIATKHLVQQTDE
jgi:hypothetical protein